MKADISIDQRGFTKIKKKMDEGVKKPLANAITRVATFMERTAKENLQDSVYKSPTTWYSRTGKARQSITRGVINPLTQRVFMGVKYGQYLETGTGIYNGRKPFWTTFGGRLERPIKYKGMQARPFWKPAIKETRKNIQRIVKEEITKEFK